MATSRSPATEEWIGSRPLIDHERLTADSEQSDASKASSLPAPLAARRRQQRQRAASPDSEKAAFQQKS